MTAHIPTTPSVATDAAVTFAASSAAVAAADQAVNDLLGAAAVTGLYVTQRDLLAAALTAAYPLMVGAREG